MGHRTIYVAGYPRSGTTWLTRLLGDALNCMTGESRRADDAIEPASEGHERPAPYVVRKGHFTLTEEQAQEPVPSSNVLAYRALRDEGVVWIHRDTRDVIASVRHYWGMSSIEEAILYMAYGTGVRVYAPCMLMWLNAPFSHIRTSYEALWADTEGEVARILTELDLIVNVERLSRTVKRQSFAVRKRHATLYGDMLPLGKAYWARFYRRGGPGHWEEQFSERDTMLAERHFGVIMDRLGYKGMDDTD